MPRSLSIAAIAATIAIPLASPVAALDLPTRKAGLWEIKIAFEGRNLPAQVAQHCIDAETDKLMNSVGGNMGRENCSKKDVQRVGNTVVVDSVCKVGEATVTAHAVVSGDFNSAYTVKVTSTREGGRPMPGVTPGAATTMTIEGKWTGACAADQKPGDMIMAGGRKFNIRDMQRLPGMAK
jgi:hypothetical protein